ncbi:MAG: 50S ribosomal protein L9 [Desulfurivibrionaceae bacterium]|nr:50S ribosomal protein L9 [Desulfobulbales bacterium]MDT8335293.1 50S ribosomal protein L9 [Desulfurivibrionaceae bacterium]
MELILRRTVDNLGEEGDVISVKPGYGRNYLLPQGIAVQANPGNLAVLEKERAAIETRKAAIRSEAENIAKKVDGTTIVIEQRAGEDDKLFGSVTSVDIAEKLASLGLAIDRKKIILDDPIKTLGEFMVKVKIAYQVTAEVKVQVTPPAMEEKA